ncbi:aldo/keto reductase [Cystobacter fuscus]|uniref:aldo/keto reductase n=1 Tax=Cystobacter fuscus TaxID=43 RepID=UPI0037C16E28
MTPVKQQAQRGATVQATAAFRRRFATAPFGVLDGLAVSTLGLGPSSAGPAESTEGALLAVELGVNVLVSAPHAQQGQHEDFVGTVVREAATRGLAEREALVLCTRVGHLPALPSRFGPRVLALEEHYVRRGLLDWGELVLGRHSLAPRFLEHSLATSRERMRLDTLDLVLLDTPELHLEAVDLPTFRARLRAACECLEELAARGWLRAYGVAMQGALDVGDVFDAARAVAGERHHLRALSLPLSLSHQDMLALRHHVGGEHLPTLEAARALGLHVLAERCLDGGHVGYEMPRAERLRLGPVVSDPQVGLQWVRSLPGMGTAVVGMRRESHVEENVGVLALPPASLEAVRHFFTEETEEC